MAGTQSALLIGATGQVGQHVLRDLLASPHFSRVGEFGRRTTPTDKLPTTGGNNKLVQGTIDFEKLSTENGGEEEKKLKEGNWDVVIVTLGTTAKLAGSAENFEKIDRDYVINAARAARTDSPSQRIIYLSSTGANSKSPFLYTKSKGLTEQAIAGLGYGDAIVFRPALLAGASRSDFRPAERIGAVFTGILAHFSNSVEIQISTLAKSIVAAAQLGSSNLPKTAQASTVGESGKQFTLIGNAGALALAKEA